MTRARVRAGRELEGGKGRGRKFVRRGKRDGRGEGEDMYTNAAAAIAFDRLGSVKLDFRTRN